MTLKPIGGQPTPRELVELAINNALPNIDDLPARSEFDITQPQLETELNDIAATQSDIRPVVRGQPSAVSVSESQTAMNTIAGSATAMDAVSASQVSMSAIAGATIAMDAVSASQTAMSRISDSATALAPFLSSPDVTTSFWSNSTGTEIFWNHNGDLSDAQFSLSSDSRFGGQSLFIDSDKIPSGGDAIQWTIDLDSINTLTVTEKAVSARSSDFKIIVNGSVLFRASTNNNSFIERSVDVSAEGSSSTVEIGIAGTEGLGQETIVSDILLS
jgi:hypothetical protein